MRHAQPLRDPQNLRAGMRARDADRLHAGHLRWDHVHQQRGGQGIAARGSIRAHRIERPHDLSQPAAVRIFHERLLRKLQSRILADIRGRDCDGAFELRRKRSFHVDADALAIEAVELARVFEQRRIAALAHVLQNRRDNALGFFQALRLARDEPARVI